MLLLSFATVACAEEFSYADAYLLNIDFGSGKEDYSASFGANAITDGSFKTAMRSIGKKSGTV